MSVLIAGSVAIDDIETPETSHKNLLGGSASYASLAAAFYGPANLVAIVGEDFPQEYFDLFKAKGVDLSGVEIKPGGKTFRWSGKYLDDMNTRETLDVQLNVLTEFRPNLSEAYRKARIALLANMGPAEQLAVLDQLDAPLLTIADSMDLWINIAREDLLKLLARIDLFVINDSEAKLFMETGNLITAGHKLLALGPKYVVIKKGEHGALLFGKDGQFFTSGAFPLHGVHDPTGAGDTFAGAMAGFLNSLGAGEISFRDLGRAVVHGSVIASFNCEGFSISRLKELTKADIDARFEELRGYTAF